MDGSAAYQSLFLVSRPCHAFGLIEEERSRSNIILRESTMHSDDRRVTQRKVLPSRRLGGWARSE